MEGRGENVMPLAASVPMWFVLLIPPLPKISNKTQQLYYRLEASHFTDGHLVDTAVKSWSKDKQIASSLFYNVFDRVAFDAFPGLKTFWERLAEVGAKDIHLVGSGPALFAPADSKAKAEEMYRRLRGHGLEAYAVSSVVPHVVI